MLARVHGRVRHMVLSRVSPLAVPVLLEIGRESVRQADGDDLRLEEAALVAEALGEADPPPLRTPAVLRPNLARRPLRRAPGQGRLLV